jgi:hypothetical protein
LVPGLKGLEEYWSAQTEMGGGVIQDMKALGAENWRKNWLKLLK